jgi:SAM-dependent methyltransferase
MKETCLFCGTEEILPYYQGVKDRLRIVQKGHDFFKCKKCGSLRLVPLPTKEYIEKSYPQECHFTKESGNKLRKIWNHLEWILFYQPALQFSTKLIARETKIFSGKVLDIGCGNAALVIKLAKKYPQAMVTGIDYWGGKWGYSKEACEKNAEIEGVANQTAFRKASASSLPFEGNYFDAVVSNFVFHEVKDSRDKREVIREALRVVKKDGVFAFQDLFLVKGIYGEVDDLLATIRSWGIQDVKFVDTSGAGFIPALLKLPFMVGSIGIIYGTK